MIKLSPIKLNNINPTANEEIKRNESNGFSGLLRSISNDYIEGDEQDVPSELPLDSHRDNKDKKYQSASDIILNLRSSKEATNIRNDKTPPKEVKLRGSSHIGKNEDNTKEVSTSKDLRVKSNISIDESSIIKEFSLNTSNKINNHLSQNGINNLKSSESLIYRAFNEPNNSALPSKINLIDYLTSNKNAAGNEASTNFSHEVSSISKANGNKVSFERMLDTTHKDNLINIVKESISENSGKERVELRVRLTPSHLGELNITIRTDDSGNLQLRIATTDESVKNLLLANKDLFNGSESHSESHDEKKHLNIGDNSLNNEKEISNVIKSKVFDVIEIS